MEGPECLSVKWTAVEVFTSRVCLFNEHTDVWAFGVLLWEIFSYGRTPYETIKATRVPSAVRRGHRLERPRDCPEVRPAPAAKVKLFYHLNNHFCAARHFFPLTFSVRRCVWQGAVLIISSSLHSHAQLPLSL
jgi:hypothetical protein